VSGKISSQELHESLNTKINKVDTLEQNILKIGDVTQLSTTNKDNLVSALNEFRDEFVSDKTYYIH